jgi:AbrB family looped-hinge helix DNA binding protein
MQTTLTSKGQVTVPVKIRAALNLRAGDQLDFQIENGTIKVTPERKKGTLDDFINALPRSDRSFSVEEMNAAIAKAACNGSA